VPALKSLTIEDQTGWQRPHSCAICQDHNTLKSVFLYDYDLSDPEFISYCTKRGIMHHVPEDSAGLSLVRDYYVDESDFYELTQKTYGVDSSTAAFAHVDWSICLAARGALQDCWQLFCEQSMY